MKKSVKSTITIVISAMCALALAIGASAADCGDVNNDSKVNARDILAIKRHIVGIELSENADANGDGKVNARDILAIKRHIVNIESLHKWETTENISCTEGGTIVTSCKKCGLISDKETVPAPGHNYVDGVCTRCGEREEITIVDIAITSIKGRNYIIGEAPDFRDAVMKVCFSDGTTEDITIDHSFGDVNYDVGYFCEKLDMEIPLHIETSTFTQSGMQPVTIEFGGATCDFNFKVEDITIESLTARDEENGVLTLIAGLSDGSKRRMKLLDIDVRTGDDSKIGGFFITDNGVFDGYISADEETFEIYISLLSGENTVRSNPLDESMWIQGFIYNLANVPYMMYMSDEISCFSGTINEGNIDALIKLAALRTGLNMADDESLPRDEVTGELLIPADGMYFIMTMCYGDEEFDITTSSFYDAELNVIRLPEMVLDEYNNVPMYPMTRTYNDGIWTVTVTDSRRKTISFCLGEFYVITEMNFSGHDFVDDICTRCGKLSENYYTKGLNYTLSNDGTYYIVTGLGDVADKVIVVPDTYNGLPVKEIGDEAFFCGKFTKIVLPDSIVSIGKSAFSASNVQSVRLPNNLEYLGEGAFDRCEFLKSINLPGSLKTINDGTFYMCFELEKIVIGDGVEEIGRDAFAGNRCYASVYMPKSVRKIAIDAFRGEDSDYTIFYDGTIDEWNENYIYNNYPANVDVINAVVICADGEFIALGEIFTH